MNEFRDRSAFITRTISRGPSLDAPNPAPILREAVIGNRKVQSTISGSGNCTEGFRRRSRTVKRNRWCPAEPASAPLSRRHTQAHRQALKFMAERLARRSCHRAYLAARASPLAPASISYVRFANAAAASIAKQAFSYYVARTQESYSIGQNKIPISNKIKHTNVAKIFVIPFT